MTIKHSLSTLHRAAAVALLVTALTSLLSPALARPSDPSEAEIAHEFRRICSALKRSGDIYWGELPMERLTSMLASEEAKAAPNPSRVAVRRLNLAKELLEAGRIDDALKTVDTKYLSFLTAIPGAKRQETHAPMKPIDENPEHTSKLSNSASSSSQDSMVVNRFSSKSQIHAAWQMLRLAAYLQKAEDQNCFLNHTATSCILPFDAGAVHREPGPARRAAEIALEILERDPNNTVARWNLNLMRMASREYPKGVPEAHRLPEELFRPSSKIPVWRNRALDLGLTKFDLAGGAIMDDFDGDGLLDLVSSTADPCDSVTAYRNNGKGGFDNVTEAWGLSGQLGGLNIVHADYDGDGALDLLLLRGGWQHEYGRIRNSLLRNELGGPTSRFVDVTRSSGLADHHYPTQTAAWADYDLDGDLDLYVGNEAFGPRKFPSQLFRNDGTGFFVDVTEQAGVENLRMAKGVAWGDYDDDGDPDLYVSNIGPNRLYRNDGKGRFTDVAHDIGVVYPLRRSFATWFFDYDNDGRLDLFVADYDSPFRDTMASYFGKHSRRGYPLIYRNTGTAFQRISAAVGLTRPLVPMGGNFGDLDNDGWLDLYLGTGEPSYLSLVPNVMLRNEQGDHFFDVSFASGVAHLQKGHGVAFGDLDNDGDQDIFHQLGGFYPGDKFSNALFENPGTGAAWITLRLEGLGGNRYGVGARIEVRIKQTKGSRSFHRLAGSGSSFGGSSMQQEIGLGDATQIDEIRIRWPGNDTIQIHRNVEINRFYRAVEGRVDLIVEERPRFRLGSGPVSGHQHDH